VALASEKRIPNHNAFQKHDKDAIWFSGQDQKTKQYIRMTTYGGSLAENITQAAARDFMAEAMLRCDQDPLYDMLLSVHDELIAEVDEDKGDVKEFEELMSVLPDWANGDLKCPVAAEGWRGKRYRK
jgi:DNA polymerase